MEQRNQGLTGEKEEIYLEKLHRVRKGGGEKGAEISRDTGIKRASRNALSDQRNANQYLREVKGGGRLQKYVSQRCTGEELTKNI